MDSQIIDEVTEWESRGFSGGYAGLHDLADEEFTGAVSEGMAWLFMLNGRVVGVFDGSIEAFEDADGTAYEAPHPSLPLLFAMRETGGDIRAKYYTEDTPLSQVDSTLSSGSFTGYVELSENVLSGDYYVVYHGGRSLACAFVGNSRQLLTGEEAFDRADDEVGIYRIVDVDIDVVDIPGSGTDSAGAGSTTAAGAAGAGLDDLGPDESDAASTPGTAAEGDVAVADAADADAADAAGVGGSSATGASDLDAAEAGGSDGDATEAGASTDDAAEASADDGATGDADVTEGPAATETTEPTDTEASAADTEASALTRTTDVTTTDTGTGSEAAPTGSPDVDASPATASAADDEHEDASATEGATGAAESTSDSAGATESTSDSENVFSEEERWREARAIPSLDPSKSRTKPGSEGDRGNQNSAGQKDRSAGAQATRSKRRPSRQSSPSRTGQGDQSGQAGSRAGSPEVAELRDRLQEVQQARAEAETAKERLAAEREELAGERDDLQEENERLRTRIDDLQEELERLKQQLSEARDRAGGPPERTMSPQQALEGTNLFVRYESKGGATLEKAHAGEVGREEAAANLRVEHHTSFETEGLHVDGRPFEEFLRGTIEYGFVQWVVGDLLYEIQETGNTNELTELFDAIPEIDRAELYGTVGIRYTEGGEQHREQQTFDVVLRDRMGNPLIVANLNDSRDPASEGEMTSLVQTARRVKETSDSLGSAFYVTSSYFEPEALETAADATGGGLLSRGKRKSFVKLSRKQGFHLCLVETREGNFHVNVPEL